MRTRLGPLLVLTEPFDMMNSDHHLNQPQAGKIKDTFFFIVSVQLLKPLIEVPEGPVLLCVQSFLPSPCFSLAHLLTGPSCPDLPDPLFLVTWLCSTPGSISTRSLLVETAATVSSTVLISVVLSSFLNQTLWIILLALGLHSVYVVPACDLDSE